MTGVEFAFKVLTVAGYAEAKDPETESDKDIAFDGNVLPRGVSHSGLDRTKHIPYEMFPQPQGPERLFKLITGNHLENHAKGLYTYVVKN